MIMNRLFITLVSLAAISAVSCSNDDEPKIPTDAIALNMMVGDNSTTIGGSDVYINSNMNFTSSYCGITDLGSKGGFKKVPALSQIAQEVAVTPGSFYQIVFVRDIRTVADERALPLNSTYYNVFVDSWIYDRENDITGAKINYAECTPEVSQLPKWNSSFEVSMKAENRDDYLETAVYSFPKGCEIDDNFEVNNIDGYNSLKGSLQIELDGNRVTFTNNEWTGEGRAQVALLVRYGSVYTRVFLIVKSSR